MERGQRTSSRAEAVRLIRSSQIANRPRRRCRSNYSDNVCQNVDLRHMDGGSCRILLFVRCFHFGDRWAGLVVSGILLLMYRQAEDRPLAHPLTLSLRVQQNYWKLWVPRCLLPSPCPCLCGEGTEGAEPASHILSPPCRHHVGCFGLFSADTDIMETLLLLVNNMMGLSWLAGSRREADSKCWTGWRFVGPVFPHETHL